MTNHWVVGRSPCRGHASNGTDGCFKVLTWNHNGIKGKQFLPREKVAATRWLITRAGPDAKKGIHTKWWEKDMENNMKNIKSQEDFDEQLLKAGDKLTLAHFFSPNCRACKALHSKVHQFARMHPGLQFVMINYNEQTEICKRLNVHVLPLFRFYRGAEGQICSFSCTISTTESCGTKGLGAMEESEYKSVAPHTDVPNASDASPNMDTDDGPVGPNNE
ncbi:thioredoxin-like 1-1, chloroplastic [Panicum virgatum]|uniref:Thioredoxin domain-containing protein n=1 Tax=Panicum virgatum TaxID=38727 RepID=A0A8T0N4C0_PANVG|nr:thioredoxin-like 1-1, chloroplastic [Panicum virgatum]KAG2543162.1 hypothetical protein PVAP13_9NG721300 [Panicum virgatum]KAG2543164.1 hypothetical protein PVAP13_9NG721300 [Panicum virgatum]